LSGYPNLRNRQVVESQQLGDFSWSAFYGQEHSMKVLMMDYSEQELSILNLKHKKTDEED
jgi:hypothetical protein